MLPFDLFYVPDTKTTDARRVTAVVGREASSRTTTTETANGVGLERGADKEARMI